MMVQSINQKTPGHHLESLDNKIEPVIHGTESKTDIYYQFQS